MDDANENPWAWRLGVGIAYRGVPVGLIFILGLGLGFALGYLLAR